MGGDSAPRTPEQAADTALWLATLPDDGPSGGFFRDRKVDSLVEREMDTLADFGGIVGSLLLLFGYRTYLKWRLRTDPYYSVQAVGNLARSAWVEHVMTTGKLDVLAVQTLRNSVMASSFMASTAILLMVGLLSLGSSLDQSNALWRVLNIGAGHDELLAIKVVLLLVDFLVAFFISRWRCASSTTWVTSSISRSPRRPTRFHRRAVAVYLNRAGNCYAFGMRAFFFAVPLVFWLFGPHFMLAATGGIIVGLYNLDRAPGARSRLTAPEAGKPPAGAMSRATGRAKKNPAAAGFCLNAP